MNKPKISQGNCVTNLNALTQLVIEMIKWKIIPQIAIQNINGKYGIS